MIPTFEVYYERNICNGFAIEKGAQPHHLKFVFLIQAFTLKQAEKRGINSP